MARGDSACLTPGSPPRWPKGPENSHLGSDLGPTHLQVGISSLGWLNSVFDRQRAQVAGTEGKRFPGLGRLGRRRQGTGAGCGCTSG